MTAPTPAVYAAIRIMRLLREAARPMGVTEMARALALNKSTVHGIVSTLVDEHFLSEVDDSKKYQLGAALIDLAEAVRGPHTLTARPFVDAYAADDGLTGFIAAPYSKSEFLITYRVEGSGSGFRLTLPVGERFPLTAGALGKAYLAWQPAHTTLDIVSRIGLPGRTQASITHTAAYLQELTMVRRSGYGESREEYHNGIKAIASPVFDNTGRVVLLVLAAGLSQDLPASNMKKQGIRLRRAAQAITKALGGVVPKSR